MKKKNKKVKDIFCDMSFFVKQNGRGGCNGCPRSRKCEEWNHENRNKRSSNNNTNHITICLSNDK